MSDVKPNRECVPLARLVRDVDLQMRTGFADGLTNPPTVEQYAEAMIEGEEFPPLEVVFDGETYWLFDGFQRAAAMERAGRSSAECWVYNGSRRDALFRSLAANARHGLSRTTQDCRRALSTLIDNPELLDAVLARSRQIGGLTRALATTCAVSKGLVAKVLEERGLQAKGGRLVKKSPVVVASPSLAKSPPPDEGNVVEPPHEGANPPAGRLERRERSDDQENTIAGESPESMAGAELEKARRSFTLFWNSCRRLLEGPYARHLKRCATQNKVPFGGEAGTDSVWWNPVRQIDSVLSDLAAATYVGLDEEDSPQRARRTQRKGK